MILSWEFDSEAGAAYVRMPGHRADPGGFRMQTVTPAVILDRDRFGSIIGVEVADLAAMDLRSLGRPLVGRIGVEGLVDVVETLALVRYAMGLTPGVVGLARQMMSAGADRPAGGGRCAAASTIADGVPPAPSASPAGGTPPPGRPPPSGVAMSSAAGVPAASAGDVGAAGGPGPLLTNHPRPPHI